MDPRSHRRSPDFHPQESPLSTYRSYEDYDASSACYDGTRVAVGVELVLGVLAAGGRALSEQTVLDLGCGTGNYLAALAPRVGELVGLEYSEGMLGRAQGKADRLDNARLVRGSAFSLPFDPQRFDAVMLNQVVHHFDDPASGSQPGAGFPMLATSLREILRVLRPGGAVLLNHCSQRQIRDGYWWMVLIPRAMEQMARRYIPLPDLRLLLAEIGFVDSTAAVPIDGLLQPNGYLDPRGPLDDGWRRADSTWSLAAADELDAGLSRLRELIAEGKADSWVAERDALRQQVGQTTYVWARRPSNV